MATRIFCDRTECAQHDPQGCTMATLKLEAGAWLPDRPFDKPLLCCTAFEPKKDSLLWKGQGCSPDCPGYRRKIAS